LIEENGCSLVKINNDAYKRLKLALWGRLSTIFCVAFVFKGATIDKKCVLNMKHSDLLKRAYSSVMGIYSQ